MEHFGVTQIIIGGQGGIQIREFTSLLCFIVTGGLGRPEMARAVTAVAVRALPAAAAVLAATRTPAPAGTRRVGPARGGRWEELKGVWLWVGPPWK